jgi:hypothetical protein
VVLGFGYLAMALSARSGSVLTALLTSLTLLLLGSGSALAGEMQLALTPAADTPQAPRMGDRMHFRSEIRNAGSQSLEGLVAWISLVEVTPGREQPIDLEDWTAQKAVTGAVLAPGDHLTTDSPVRLIQSGDYRVVISATDRNDRTVATSQTLQFHVAHKATVESARIVPVAVGVPFGIACLIGYRGWTQRRLGRQSWGHS